MKMYLNEDMSQYAEIAHISMDHLAKMPGINIHLDPNSFELDSSVLFLASMKDVKVNAIQVYSNDEVPKLLYDLHDDYVVESLMDSCTDEAGRNVGGVIRPVSAPVVEEE